MLEHRLIAAEGSSAFVLGPEGFHLEVNQARRVTQPAPLVHGPSFGLVPEEVREEVNRLEFRGANATCTFTGSVATVPGSEWFRVVIDVESEGFVIGTRGGNEPEIVLDLGLLPPYERGDHVWFKTLVENPAQWNHEARGNDFPATYYFDPYLQAEFMMFFDMTAMNWMSAGSLARFYDVKCGFRREFGGAAHASLGMLADTQSGHLFPAGRQRFAYFVSARHRVDDNTVPSEQDALVALVDACLPLTRLPGNRWPGGDATWAEIAQGTAVDLMSTDHSWGDDPEGEHLFGYVDGRSDAWVATMTARGRVFGGRGPCVEAALWTLRPLDEIDSVFPGRHAELRVRLEHFVRRHLLTRVLTGRSDTSALVGTWQYLYIVADAWFLYSDRGDEEMLDRITIEIDEVVIPLAEAVQYAFPLQFDRETLRKAGPGNNIASCGIFALLMTALAQRTGSQRHLEQAQRALRTLANVPIDDALQEVFLVAHAIDAADRMLAMTGDAEWLQLRTYFRAQTLRMMYWYDDRTSDRVSEFDHLGMFLACANINYPAFFENIEVDARLARALPYESDPSMLLKVLDYGRRTNFSFFPSVSPELFGPMPLNFIPFEEVPLLDGPVDAGFVGQEIYGAGWSFRAHLLWDALATSSDREVMVVHAGGYGSPQRGDQDVFFLYNGTDREISTDIRFAVKVQLALTTIDAGAALTYTLASGAWIRLDVKGFRE